MGRAHFAIVVPAWLVAIAFAIALGSAACESTLNLSNADASSPDAGPLTCVSSCNRIIDTCRLFSTDKRGECLSQCNATGRPSDLACVAQTACADIERTCGDGERDGASLADSGVINEFKIHSCQAACDNSAFFSCLTAPEQSMCRALCAAESATKRDGYEACALNSGGDCARSHDCFDLFAKD